MAGRKKRGDKPRKSGTGNSTFSDIGSNQSGTKIKRTITAGKKQYKAAGRMSSKIVGLTAKSMAKKGKKK
jgi:hypothetical protein